MFWLHFWEAVMPSIFIYSPCPEPISYRLMMISLKGRGPLFQVDAMQSADFPAKTSSSVCQSFQLISMNKYLHMNAKKFKQCKYKAYQSDDSRQKLEQFWYQNLDTSSTDFVYMCRYQFIELYNLNLTEPKKHKGVLPHPQTADMIFFFLTPSTVWCFDKRKGLVESSLKRRQGLDSIQFPMKQHVSAYYKECV